MDEGKVDLNAPVERHLKRWKLPLSALDPAGVTVRRLLSHTAGLEPRSYHAGDPRFGFTDLVSSLNGPNNGTGPVRISWAPGTEFHYAGGGFAVLQLLVEDVTGETFEDYVTRVIFQPLGMSSAAWHWSPERIALAATPYGYNGERLPSYDYSEAAIGSESMSVTDFARFVAAAVPGPDGQPGPWWASPGA